MWMMLLGSIIKLSFDSVLDAVFLQKHFSSPRLNPYRTEPVEKLEHFKKNWRHGNLFATIKIVDQPLASVFVILNQPWPSQTLPPLSEIRVLTEYSINLWIAGCDKAGQV